VAGLEEGVPRPVESVSGRFAGFGVREQRLLALGAVADAGTMRQLRGVVGNRALQRLARDGGLLSRREVATRSQRRPASRPAARRFDVAYGLYLSADGTRDDGSSGRYELSSWDLGHLVRSRGFYFLITDRGTSLIMPPEVRRVSGGSGVLLPLSAADYEQVLASPDATVRTLVRRDLGVSVPRLTHAAGPDRDFSVPELPPPVAASLAAPGSVEGRAARGEAAATRQASTLESAAARGEELPLQEIQWKDRMSPSTLAEMSQADRAAWYVRKLGPLQAQLHVSAQRHHIPMQLLAVVILNELADINEVDVWQSGPGTLRGSLGIAQIQVDTAIRDRLVDVDPREAESALRTAGVHIHGRLTPSAIQAGLRLRVAQRLQVPQVAVEAAAREIEILLLRMGQHRNRPWQRQHGFAARGTEGAAIYDRIGSTGESREAREGLLARMVTAAYNSPEIIVSPDPGPKSYSNANIHGDNGRLRAMELYRLGLFRTGAHRPRGPVPAPVSQMRFNGRSLTLEYGTARESFTAISGKRANNPENEDRRDHTGPDSQNLAGVGPIPEGTYHVYPSMIERGYKPSVWGPVRVKIFESTLTKLGRHLWTKRTGGFFVHLDVKHDGTAGCIGLQSRRDLLSVMARIGQTEYPIPLTVKY
jgi:hypothetical protein